MVKSKSLLITMLFLSIVFLTVSSIFKIDMIHLGFCSENVLIVPEQFSTITEALNNATNGNTIFVTSGNYTEYHMLVNKTVNIIGEDAENTVIDGENTANYIFHVIASNVTIENFTMKNTKPDPFSDISAIKIYNAVNVTVKNVRITNVVIGVDIESSNCTEIRCNRINGTITWGVRVRHASCNNTIVGNTFEHNPTAIWFTDSESEFTRVYHNNFINNTIQFTYLVNYFHNGYPSGGNYWSDHIAADLYHGPGQNISGSDGILDKGYPAYTPWDKYPLAHPLTMLEVAAEGESFEVEVSTNSSLNSFEFDGGAKRLTLFLNGTEGTNGSCRVSIPKRLLSCSMPTEWNVSICNGDRIPRLPLEDEDETYLYFTYNHAGIEGIEIEGTMAIPEFTSVIMTLILMAFTLLIAAIKKLKANHKKCLRRL